MFRHSAESLCAQEESFGRESPRLLNNLRQYERVLRMTGHPSEADAVQDRLQAISARIR